MNLIRSKIDKIGEKLTVFLKKLKNSQNDDISDLLNQILGKENDDDDGNDPKNISVGNSINKSARFNLAELEENGSATNISFRISAAISKAQTSSRRANNIKIK